MASVVKRHAASGPRYDVRYRDPSRKVRTKTFRRKVDADRYAAQVEADVLRGDWLDPAKGRVTFGEWADAWLASKVDLRVSSQVKYRATLDRYLLPELGSTGVSGIDHPALSALLAEMKRKGLSGSTIGKARSVAKQVFDFAIRSGAIKHNPAAGIKVATSAKKERKFLTIAEVHLLADEISNPPHSKYQPNAVAKPDLGLIVKLAAFTGLRIGEIAALRVSDLDLFRRRVYVRNTVSDVAGTIYLNPTKTSQERSVPLTAALVDELMQHLAGRGQDEFAFVGQTGEVMRPNNFRRRQFNPAKHRCGFDTLRVHDLRHTCAALLIEQGAHPKQLQQWLGHSQISVTLDTYGHLLPGLEAGLVERLDAAAKTECRTGSAGPLRLDTREIGLSQFPLTNLPAKHPPVSS